MTPARVFLTASLIASFVSLAPVARAASKKEECISAFDNGQRARREGHLKQAHEALLVCAQSDCPTVIRADCSDVLRQVDGAQPTVVFGAADASGKDLTDVVVELDGKPLVTSLDGRAIEVDPGKLTFVFKHAPWEPVSVEVVIKEAEKTRNVRATLGPKAAPEAATKPVAPLATTEEPKRSVAGYAVPGALGVLGLGALAFAGITRLGAGSDADDLKSRCGPTCPESERDDLSSTLVRANVGLGIGIGALVAAAATWFILAPHRSEK